jgi:hypothetical protein
MEVRTVLATLLSRFWLELSPSMGRGEQLDQKQQVALTLKIAGGLQLLCKPHGEQAGQQQLSKAASSSNSHKLW